MLHGVLGRAAAALLLAEALVCPPPLDAAEASQVLTPQQVEQNITAFGFGSNAQPGDRLRVECADLLKGGQLSVIVIAGQSNAGNHAGKRFSSHDGVYNFNIFDRECYRAEDPLLGTTGTDGSLFTRLGQLLVERGVATAVLLVPIAIGGASIEDWAPDGRFFPRFMAAIDGLRSRGLAPTMFLWQQGEANFVKVRDKTDPEGITAQYAAEVKSIVAKLRETGVKAPFLVAQGTLCWLYSWADWGIELTPGHKAVQAGQRAAVDPEMGIYPGPDTDHIYGAERDWRQCHFSGIGAEHAAELWFSSVVAARSAVLARSEQGSAAEKQTIQLKFSVSMPTVQAWLMVSAISEIQTWHPLVASSETYGKDTGAYGERIMHMKGGGTVIDDLIALSNETMTIKMRTAMINWAPLPVAQMETVTKVRELQPGKVEIVMDVDFIGVAGRPFDEVRQAVLDFLNAGMEGAKAYAAKISPPG